MDGIESSHTKSRRTWILISVLAIALAASVVAISAWERRPSSETSWLFTHTSDTGSLASKSDGTFTLTLSGISPRVIAFSDRPERDATIISTAGLIHTWPTLFKDSAPNAVLVEHLADGDTRSLPLTLLNPKVSTDTITFDARPMVGELPARISEITGTRHSNLPSRFSNVSLFIDNVSQPCATPTDCNLLSPIELGILRDLGYTEQSPPATP